MGLLGKVGKGIGKAAIKAGKTGAAGIKKRKLQNSVEMRILARYKTEHFNKLLKRYGLEGPSKPERGYLKKEDYIDYVHDHFKLSTIIAFAEENRIPISDIMEDYKKAMELIEKEAKMEETDKEFLQEEKKSTEKVFEADAKRALSSHEGAYRLNETHDDFQEDDSTKEEFNKIISAIEKDFGDIIRGTEIKSEKDMQSQLYVFLKTRFKDKNIKQKVDWKADFLIDNKFALELKYGDNRNTLDTGVREVKSYCTKYTKYVAVIILDIGKLSQEVLDEYVGYYKGECAEVLILRGHGGRKKKKRRSHQQ